MTGWEIKFVEVKNKLDSHHKVVINLHGLACSIKEVRYINISIDEFKNMAHTLRVPIEELVLDEEFNTFNHRAVKAIYQGLTMNNKSQVEIRINGRKKRTIYYHELLDNSNLLFPLYDVVFIKQELKKHDSIYVIEKEMGLIASYSTSSNKFEIDHLRFELTRVSLDNDEFVLLTNIICNDIELQTKKSDSVVVGSYVVM